MAVKAENKRVSVVMNERDQKLYGIIEKRDEADYQPTTATSVYRHALTTAHYADWTQKPVEKMDFHELALFVATYDFGIGCGSEDNGAFVESTSARDDSAYEKAVVELAKMAAATAEVYTSQV